MSLWDNDALSVSGRGYESCSLKASIRGGGWKPRKKEKKKKTKQRTLFLSLFIPPIMMLLGLQI